MNKKKILITGCVIFILILVLCCNTFSKESYNIEDINKIELMIDADFKTVILTEDEDISTVINEVNSRKAVFPDLSLASTWPCTIRMYFSDGNISDFTFLCCEFDENTKNAKMIQIYEGAVIGKYFEGELFYTFLKIAAEREPNSINVEWYNNLFDNN